MAIKRLFLDWQRPALAAAVDYLVQRFASAGKLNLEKVVLALPGGRAGRRLLEILVAEAETRHLQLRPPRIVTAGELPDRLYEPKRPFATNLVQQLAWSEALRASDPRHVQAVVPLTPADDDLPAWLSLGEMLGRLHRELAAGDLDFAIVAQRGRQIKGFQEAPRWQALAEIQAQYLGTLDRLGLWDRQTARLEAIRRRECRSEDEIFLIGTVDLNRTQRKMLDQVADRVTALVFAPEKLQSRFDEHGCVSPAEWLQAEIPLADRQIEVADDPVAQADAVLRPLPVSRAVTIPNRLPSGCPTSRSCLTSSNACRNATFPPATAWARGLPVRPPTASWPRSPIMSKPRRSRPLPPWCGIPGSTTGLAAKGIAGDWLSQMDRYHAEHLPQALDGPWQGEAKLCESLAAGPACDRKSLPRAARQTPPAGRVGPADPRTS